MATTNSRFTLTVPNDMAKRAETLKKDIFYDRPYAEMYRHLIQIGMDTIMKKSDSTSSIGTNTTKIK